MKLQACPKCEAQFDVSGYAVGEKFTCGACEYVITAHKQAPGRMPKARTPGTRAGATAATGARRTPRVASGPRGPQYKPVDRGGTSKKAVTRTRRSGASATRPSRTRGDAASDAAPAGAGPNKALLGGVLAVIVIGAAALFLMGGEKKNDTTTGGGTDTASGTPNATPAVPTETAATIMEGYKAKKPRTGKQWRTVINRLKALGDAEGAPAALRAVYGDYVQTTDGMDDKGSAYRVGVSRVRLRDRSRHLVPRLRLHARG